MLDVLHGQVHMVVDVVLQVVVDVMRNNVLDVMGNHMLRIVSNFDTRNQYGTQLRFGIDSSLDLIRLCFFCKRNCFFDFEGASTYYFVCFSSDYEIDFRFYLCLIYLGDTLFSNLHKREFLSMLVPLFPQYDHPEMNFTKCNS